MLPTTLLPTVSLMPARGLQAGAPPAARAFRPATRPVREGRFIGLGEALFQVFPFETRRRGEARTCPPRTVGWANMLLRDGRGGLGWVGPHEAADFYLRTRGAGNDSSNESAKEKVIFCNRPGETRVFQADRQNNTAALCACGNAAGAAAAMLAHCLKKDQLHHDLHVPDGRLDMVSGVTHLRRDEWRVEQAWTGIRLEVIPTRLGSRPVAVCTGSFNDYLIVLLEGPSDLEQFDLPEVLALWREARQFSGFENPLQSRLAAIVPGGARPFARFYTCGRMHPGAPLTGLATLAMAANRVSWLAPLLQGGVIEHRRGVDALPAIQATGKGYEVHFPTIDVVLQGV